MLAAAEIAPSLTLTRVFKAPPEILFAAWTDPEKIARWWGPGADDDVLAAEIDCRVGGKFRIVSHSHERSEDDEVSGEYLEIVPNRKLAFTWFWRSTPDRISQVLLFFEPHGSGETAFTLHHERFFNETARDNHATGWAGALAKLEALYE